MSGFTHYSLFEGHTTLRDFARLPVGGLPVLLDELHRMTAPELPNHCLSIIGGTLHPNGEQMSFGVGRNQVERFAVILMTETCVASHASELASEGNTESAALAEAALQS